MKLTSFIFYRFFLIFVYFFVLFLMFFNSPLEQFDTFILDNLFFLIVNLSHFFSFNFGLLDIGFDLPMIYLFSVLLLLFFIIKIIIQFNLFSNFLDSFFEKYSFIWYNIFCANAGKLNDTFFPLFFSIASFLLCLNLIGLLPYSYTVTAHILLTAFFSFSVLFGITLLGVFLHGFDFLNLFLPKGTPFIIMPFIYLLEIISYLSRIFSLAIRLFANMMAGHTLMHILSSFMFQYLLSINSFIKILIAILPIFIILLIVFMEIGVAILQIYVFFVLISLYIKDSVLLSH